MKWSTEAGKEESTYECDWCRLPISKGEVIVERGAFGVRYHYHKECVDKYHEQDDEA